MIASYIQNDKYPIQIRYIKTEHISSFVYIRGDIYKKVLIVCGGVEHVMYLTKDTEEDQVVRELLQLQRGNDEYDYKLFTIVHVTD